MINVKQFVLNNYMYPHKLWNLKYRNYKNAMAIATVVVVYGFIFIFLNSFELEKMVVMFNFFFFFSYFSFKTEKFNFFEEPLFPSTTVITKISYTYFQNVKNFK